MANWKEIQLGIHKVKIRSVTTPKVVLQDCSDTGQALTKRQLQRATYNYFLPDGTEYAGKIMKLINNKAFDKMKATKTSKIFMVEKDEADDLIATNYWIAESDTLKEAVGSDKAGKFLFTNGRGFKLYTCYIYQHVSGTLVMKGGEINCETRKPTYLTELLLEHTEQAQLKAELQALTNKEMNVPTEEELLAIM